MKEWIAMPLSPQELARQIQGLLSFPVTPFDAAGEVDLPRFREHISYMANQNPAGLFVCGGTGEFYSLGLDEYRALVRAAVEEIGGKLPIVAGVGYGARLALDFARAAEQAGADGLMVMPPYLVVAEQEGLYQHYRALAAATRLGVILYQRDNAIFMPATVRRLAEIPNVIGFKDGYGDMERLLRIRLAAGERLTMLNGMPTAELSQPAFVGVGVRSYSSAVFNFVPEISWAFYRATVEGDADTQLRLLEGFYRPFAELRDRARGYAVALIKAGLKVQGRPVGPARAPLVNPTPEHEAELKAIVERGLALVG
jgi:5-dehydro-4-deoxyglucarate dehydratase